MGTPLEESLLAGWEDVHKKSQLTLWILLALKQHPKSMSAVKDFIHLRTNDTISADDKSIYRALRRFAEANLITATLEANPAGPDIKIWSLTSSGNVVLKEFITRNIQSVLLRNDNAELWR